MEDTMLIKSLSAAAAAAALAFAPMAPASADLFPAGIACEDFDLQVDVTGDDPQVDEKTFEGRDGSLRILSAGTGSDLVFTNLESGATFSLTGNGFVSWTRIDADGSVRVTLTGHNVLIYFPTDTPAGPSTTLVVGREDFTIDSEGNFHQLSRTGHTTDICAALS
jgi:hypothetical protein